MDKFTNSQVKNYIQDGQRLKLLRVKIASDRSSFANDLGISVEKLQNIELGRVKISVDIALKCEKLFGDPHPNFRWLLTGEGEMFTSDYLSEESASIPILGGISAGHSLESLALSEDGQQYIEMPYSWLRRGPEAYFALVVNGNSMIGAGIEHGDLVVLEKTNDRPPVGRICAVQITGRGVTLRRVYPRKDGTLKLVAENPAVPDIRFDPEDDVKVVVLGKAWWLFREIGEEALVLK